MFLRWKRCSQILLKGLLSKVITHKRIDLMDLYMNMMHPFYNKGTGNEKEKISRQQDGMCISSRSKSNREQQSHATFMRMHRFWARWPFDNLNQKYYSAKHWSHQRFIQFQILIAGLWRDTRSTGHQDLWLPHSLEAERGNNLTMPTSCVTFLYKSAQSYNCNCKMCRG